MPSAVTFLHQTPAIEGFRPSPAILEFYTNQVVETSHDLLMHYRGRMPGRPPKRSELPLTEQPLSPCKV